MEPAQLQGWVTEGLSTEMIGRRVGRHPSTVAYWLRKHGIAAAHAQRHAAKGGLGRAELTALVERGATQAQIAATLEVGVGTVRHWLRKYDLRTLHAQQYARGSKNLGALVTRRCRRHGLTTYVASRDGRRYRCLRCRTDAVSARRRHVKRILVAEAGGCCRLCGYDRCAAALQFHHLDPRQKRFNVSLQGEGRSLATARQEARKCVLLCATCHAELEAGVAILPAEARWLPDG